MAFDTTTRNELQKVVGLARELLVKEFTLQCQGVYGIQPDGSSLDVSDLGHLSEEERTKAQLLRERVNHLTAGIAGSKKKTEAVTRLVREQAFTVLNRLFWPMFETVRTGSSNCDRCQAPRGFAPVSLRRRKEAV